MLCLMCLQSKRKDKFYTSRYKEGNGMHGCVRKQIESFEFGRDTFGSLPTGVFLI